MIRISGLSHRIGKSAILHDISADLPKGKLTALIGPNGAGKSTLLRLIGRLEPLQSGSVTLDGVDLSRTPTNSRSRRRLAIAVCWPSTAILCAS